MYKIIARFGLICFLGVAFALIGQAESERSSYCATLLSVGGVLSSADNDTSQYIETSSGDNRYVIVYSGSGRVAVFDRMTNQELRSPYRSGNDFYCSKYCIFNFPKGPSFIFLPQSSKMLFYSKEVGRLYSLKDRQKIIPFDNLDYGFVASQPDATLSFVDGMKTQDEIPTIGVSQDGLTVGVILEGEDSSSLFRLFKATDGQLIGSGRLDGLGSKKVTRLFISPDRKVMVTEQKAFGGLMTDYKVWDIENRGVSSRSSVMVSSFSARAEDLFFANHSIYATVESNILGSSLELLRFDLSFPKLGWVKLRDLDNYYISAKDGSDTMKRVSLVPGGRHLVLWSSHSIMKILLDGSDHDGRTEFELHKKLSLTKPSSWWESGFTSAEVSLDGRWIVVTDGTQVIELIDAETGELIQQLNLPYASRYARFTDDSNQILVAIHRPENVLAATPRVLTVNVESRVK